eukprot:2033197-Amphidinium_carterae.3
MPTALTSATGGGATKHAAKMTCASKKVPATDVRDNGCNEGQQSSALRAGTTDKRSVHITYE